MERSRYPSSLALLLLLACSLAGLLGVTLPAVAADANILRSAAAFHDKVELLRNKAKNRGAVQVIVQLDDFPDLLLHLPPTDQAGRLAVIRGLQEDLLLSVGKQGRISHAKQFAFAPYLALEVDEPALFALEHHPRILDIEEDAAHPPTLAQSVPLIGADTAAWDLGLTGNGQVVAILDTGVDKTQPFLAGKVISEACYSTTDSTSISLCPNGTESSTALNSGVNCSGISGCDHGTHVAGIAAGKDPGGVGFNGVAKDASLISIQVFSKYTEPAECSPRAAPCVLARMSDIMLALERVLVLSSSFPIAAVNISLGSGQYAAACDTNMLKIVIDNLRLVGIPVVISSGNESYKTAISSPACISSAISVGATCDYGIDGTCAAVDAVASFSNIAPFLTLVAPGSSIRSSVPGGSYAAWNGTSMAAPHVAGAWAIKKQENASASVDTVLSFFRTNAKAIDDTRSGGTVKGLGRIQFHAPPLSVTTIGGGVVTSKPAGVNCGSFCSAKYLPGTAVTLTATAEACASFSGWGGDCFGTGTCSLTMDSAKTVIANFGPARTETFFRDADGDGYGDPALSLQGCAGTPPAGFVPGGTDCADTVSAIHPGASDTACDGIDQDCDGADAKGAACTDTDGDGTVDSLDGCPLDAAKTAPGACGCGLPDADGDGDGVADCVDLCPGSDDRADRNQDNVPDFCQDSDLDGMTDGWEWVYGLDPFADDAFTDRDADGYSNLREFLSGTGPLDPSDRPIDRDPRFTDLDGDRDMDGAELASCAADFSRTDCGPASVCPCDLDGNGRVDVVDLRLFLEDFSRAY